MSTHSIWESHWHIPYRTCSKLWKIDDLIRITHRGLSRTLRTQQHQSSLGKGWITTLWKSTRFIVSCICNVTRRGRDAWCQCNGLWAPSSLLFSFIKECMYSGTQEGDHSSSDFRHSGLIQAGKHRDITHLSFHLYLFQVIFLATYLFLFEWG